jgi:hypothetical protein
MPGPGPGIICLSLLGIPTGSEFEPVDFPLPICIEFPFPITGNQHSSGKKRLSRSEQNNCSFKTVRISYHP